MALGLLASACSDNSGSAANATASGSTASGSGSTAGAAKDTPKPGGTLRFALAVDPECVDPQQGSANASLNIGRQVVDSLTDQDPTTGKLIPWLAESWEVDAEAKTYTFKLRTGVTFADGTPFNAASVKANFEEIVKLGAKSLLGSSYLAGLNNVTAVDDRTVRIEFKSSNAQFLQASSTMSLGFLSTATIAKDPKDRCAGQIVGTGPFNLKSYTANQNVLIEKRAGYAWGSTLFAHTGEAYLDAIDFKIIPESGVRLGSLQSGQVNAISDVQPQDEPQFKSGDYSILTRGNPGLPFGLHANAARSIVSEEPVRLAISKALNRKEISSTVLTDLYKSATSILASSTPGYADQSAALAFDAAGAAKLLDDAGWKLGSDGYRSKDGKRLSVDVIFTPLFNGSGRVLELVQQQLKKSGIELRLRQVTVADQTTITHGGDYDYLWSNLTRVDPDVLRTIFSTKAANRTHIADVDLDALLDKQAATSDVSIRNPLLAQVQQRVIAKGYFVPVFELAQVHGLSSKVKGLRFEASSRLSFYDTWLAK